jgi:dihydroorotate dehydrogenase (fumarate)
MGLKLRNPIIVAASDLTNSSAGIIHCYEAGAGAVVMKSLFEEQFWVSGVLSEKGYPIYPEALDYLRSGGLLEYTPQKICRIIEEAKKDIKIPLIASINCQSPKLWPSFARQFQEAGADGLELNIYFLPFDLTTPGSEYEKFYFQIFEEVKKAVSIPISIKLGSQLTSIPYMAHKLAESGCKGLVFFNWFLEPEIDIEHLRTKNLMGKGNFYQSLRWVALLAGRVGCDIASSGRVRRSEDVIKQILAGASACQVCTLFYQEGLRSLRGLLSGLEAWMDGHFYSSINDFRGELSFKSQKLSFKEPEMAEAYFRAQYIKVYSKKD